MISINRYVLLLLGLAVCACQSPSGNSDTTVERLPNFIVIFADDLGYADLSCYGHPNIYTPRLDQMAREGIRMTNWHSAAPVCTPSRASLMTGRYPIRVGMPGNQGPDSKGGLSDEERTLAQALKTKGYKTAAFGKWHLGSTPGFFPTDKGFDKYFGLLYSNDMIPPWVNTKRPLHLYRNDQPMDEQPVNQTTLTKRYTEEAIRFIQENKASPFFIYLPHSMPHLPIYASEDFTGKSKGGDYGDVIEEIDAGVGQILDVLKEEGLDEQTLVVFTSDNGPWRNLPPRMYESEPVEKWHVGTTGPFRGAKATTYEGGFRVPGIMRWPGHIPAGQVNYELVTTMDVHTTILNLAEVAPPDKPLDGKDIWPLITEKTSSPHDYFYYFLGRNLQGVQNATWKLRIAPPADNWLSPELQTGDEPIQLELFDLTNDPYEQFDVAAQHPDMVNLLKQKMDAMAEETGAKLAAFDLNSYDFER